MFLRQHSAVSLSPRLFLFVLLGGMALSAPATLAAQQRPQPLVGSSPLTITPSPVVFAETSPGSTSATAVATVKNPNTGAATVGTVSISGTNSGDFAITANTCGSSLAAGATCTVTLDFTPTANGARTATLSVPSSAGSATAMLNGQAGMATFSPSPLTFAPTVIGQTTASQTTTLTNNSPNSDTMTLSANAAASLSYTITASTCTSGTQLMAGQSCTVTVAFSPTAIGTQNGTITVTDDVGTQTAALSGIGLLVNPAVTTFPAETVGSTESATVTFNFGGPGTVKNFLIVTQGSQNLDFATGTQGSTYCNSSAGTYQTGSSCTVTVNFTPIAPGPVTGAVYLYDNESTPVLIGIGYLRGIGNGPQAALYPGTQSTIFANTAGDAFGLAVDLKGDVFYDNSTAGNVTKQSLAGTTYTATTLGNGLGNFSNFAIDGAGYLFMASSGVMEEAYTPSTTSYTQSTAISGVGAYATAIDSSNNLYVASGGTLYKETPSGGSYTSATISTGFNNIIGLTVDSSNNLYVADAGNAALYELPYANGTYPSTPTTVATGLGNANSVATDAAGTVYTVADSSYNGVLRYAPASGGGFTALPAVGSFSRANGVALDRLGNLYVTDDGSNQNSVKEINVNGTESFTFAATLVGATSATQTAILVNTGNTNMTVTGLTFYGPFGSSTTLSSCATLAPGAICAPPIAFTPTTIGAATGSLVFTDNTLGVAGTTQTVNLSGTGYENLTFTAAPPASLTVGGNAGTVTVSAEKSGGSVDTTQTPSVTLTVTGPNSYSQSSTVTASNGVASFNLSSAALTTAGMYSYAVTTTTANFNAPTTASETVVPGPATLSVTPASTTAYIGYPDSITVSAYDTYGNLATNYAGSVQLSTTDPGPATVPAPFTLSSGTATKAVNFKTATITGWTVTATDTVTSSITGSSAAIVVQPVPAYTVTTLTDDNGSASASNCENQASGAVAQGSCSLRDAIAATNALSFTGTTNVVPTVSFAPALSGNTLNLSAAVYLTANVNIAGPGAALLTIAPATTYTYNAFTSTTKSLAFTLSGVTVTGFGIPGSASGAALYFAPATAAAADLITLSNDTFTSNGGSPTGTTASTEGGGLYTDYSTMVVTGSTFTGNSASVGGAVYAINSQGVTITGSTFGASGAPNRALATDGGAVFLSSSPATISTSTFAYNTSKTYGAGVFENSALTLNTDVFLNNAATVGGAVYVAGALTVAGSTFNSNTATANGGAIYVTGLLTVSGSSFMANQAGGSTTLPNGGAIYSNSTVANSISSTNFLANRAVVTGSYAYGGALYALVANLTNVLFSGNSTSSALSNFGGAVYFGPSSATSQLIGVTFTGNSTTGSATNQEGGAIFLNSNTLKLFNVTISGNSAKIGGGIYAGAGTLSLFNSVITGNSATTSSPDLYGNPTNAGSSYYNNGSAVPCSSSCTPILSALGNYGGGTVGAPGYTTPVEVMLPLPGSPLLAAGSLSYVGSPGTLSGGATTDARGTGFPRTLTEAGGSQVDIGAAEANYALAFVQQPSNTLVGATVSPAPTVQLLESGNQGGDGVGSDPGSFAGGSLVVAGTPDAASTATVTTAASGLESLSESFSTAATGETLTVNAQSGASTPVVVGTATSNSFTVTPPTPTVTGVSPTTGPAAGGSSVTITGTNLTGATGVTFGGTSATNVTVVSSTQVTATTPAVSAGAVDVLVTTPGGTATLTNGYTYVAALGSFTVAGYFARDPYGRRYGDCNGSHDDRRGGHGISRRGDADEL